MPEQEMNSAAAKFISSLVKSLQILCNGHVDFSESIELVGHINVKIDHKLKFDYIVDEQVSKEGQDSSTTFLSNSYHSCPPSRLQRSKQGAETGKGCTTRSTIRPAGKSLQDSCDKYSESNQVVGDLNIGTAEQKRDYSVSIEESSSRKDNQMIVKLEEDSDDCMVLPASPGEYEAVPETSDIEHEVFPSAGPSGSFDDTQGAEYDNYSVKGNTSGPPGKRRKTSEKGVILEDICDEVSGAEDDMSTKKNSNGTPVLRTSSRLRAKSNAGGLSADHDEVQKITPEMSICQNMAMTELARGKQEFIDDSQNLKELLSKVTKLCDIVQNDIHGVESGSGFIYDEESVKTAKKKFFECFNKTKIKKMKEVLKSKKGKNKKKELKTLIAESGLTNEQLVLLAQDAPLYKRRMSWKAIPDGPDKEEMRREHKRLLRVRTQQRQRKILEMAEMLKRSQGNDPGLTVFSKKGTQKCTLKKSPVSVVSHQTQQLTPDNIDEAVDALTGKVKGYQFMRKGEKLREEMRTDSYKRHGLKRKMKQIITKMLSEIHEAGYRVSFTNTIGSDAGSHSAELSVIPVKVEEVLLEMKETDGKLEMTEEEYSKHLEREQFIEKQKANERKMKDMEVRLVRILTGVEEIFMPSRKRYAPGESRPTDAERMKEYRKKLKEDPEKFQVYKQKRAMNKKKRRLSALAAKVKEGATNTAVIPSNPVNEESHNPQAIGSLVSITQPVGTVSMHCPQVYGHPNSHQPPSSVVNVHHTTQYVSQVAGIHTSHQHQQPISYGNEMDIVELITATHNVQNQHFGAADGMENKAEEEGEGSTHGGKRSASELIGKFAAYECSYCSVILTEYDDLSLHSKSCPSPSCSMICLTCGEKFPNKPDMRQHLKFVHSHKTFGCKFCDMMFLSSSGLLSHTKAKHKPDPKTLCQICGQAFHNKANLEGHMNMHLGIRPFKCKKCGKSYGHSKSLITHEKSCKSIATVGEKVKSSVTPVRKSVSSGIKTTSSGPAPNRTPKQPEKKRTNVEENVSNISVSESDQSFTFNETYQTYDECENKKEMCNNERNLQLLQNASQPFTFTEPFHQVFHEASPHAMNVPSASNPSSVSESVGNTVYGPTSATFVLPQVAYGMYPQGMMPDQR